MGDQGIGRSPWRRQICSAERKSNRRRNIRQRQGLTTDGAHGRQSRRDCGRSGRLGPAAAQCIEATTDHVADTHPQWIPSGLVDQRHCQIDHYRRRAATCARRRGGDPVGDRVRSHWPDRGRDWGLAGRPRHLAGLRQAPFALLSFSVVGAVLALATPVVREWLFGTQQQPGWVGTHAYWLGAQWWHPWSSSGSSHWWPS